ncbi:hypothetical protein CBOM_01603 [Ceraceosorus bombacis]|uniref:Uncharacterized protein n=1 Tax=Ceraceosorus bombacis TaxID=401625 RepID=A0A0P1BDQ3_9BASI|nr:hypothetical protein CBOM_01603 [Ceraceosorus bombacis]
MSNGRSSTVVGLSGRLQGLKFMQRANAQQQQQQQQRAPDQSVLASTSSSIPRTSRASASPQSFARASTSAQTPAAAPASAPQPVTLIATQARQGKDASQSDEEWCMPSARSASDRPTSSAVKVEHEPAWSSWLASAGAGLKTEHDPVDLDVHASAPSQSTRRSFGAWAQKKRQKSRKGSESDAESDDDDGDDDKKGARAYGKSRRPARSADARVDRKSAKGGRAPQGGLDKVSLDEESLDEKEVEGLAIIDEIKRTAGRASGGAQRHSDGATAKKRKHSQGRAHAHGDTDRTFKKPGRSPW